jgi:sodium/proline symporter
MGLPGVAYLSGSADVAWTSIGLALGTYVNWLITAKRLRVYTRITDSFTLPQFFSARFHDNRHILTAFAAAIIVIFFIPYTASGFAACGKLFNSLFGADYMTAMIVSAVVIVSYTAAGGFLAASTTDFVQSIIMTFALLFVLLYSVGTVGGVDAVLANAKALPGYLSLTETYVAKTNSAAPYTFLTIVSTMAWGLGYFGMPHILLRFMAIEDKDKLAMSRRVASVWVVIAMFIAVAIGIVGKTMTDAGLVKNLTGANSETIIIQIANTIAEHGVLMAIGAGLVLAGILASTMSTADSQLLAAASSVSQDIMQGTMRANSDKKAMSQGQSMFAARITVIVIAILAVIIARDPNSSVFKIVAFSWAGFGASFGPLVLASLFWKRVTFEGALSGMVAGGLMIFIWKFLIAPMGGVFGIYELLPAFLVSLITLVGVSLMTEPDEDVMKEFEEMERSL